jgi:O-methyltransferase involved in polyketide biosynthesis
MGRERVVKIFGAVPDRVVLVPTDFTTPPLDEVLRDAGYDRTQRTFFIWEGVAASSVPTASRTA